MHHRRSDLGCLECMHAQNLASAPICSTHRNLQGVRSIWAHQRGDELDLVPVYSAVLGKK